MPDSVALICVNFHISVVLGVKVLFTTYLVDPVSYLSGEKPAPIIDVLES